MPLVFEDIVHLREDKNDLRDFLIQADFVLTVKQPTFVSTKTTRLVQTAFVGVAREKLPKKANPNPSPNPNLTNPNPETNPNPDPNPTPYP